jgi:hypothetical protein
MNLHINVNERRYGEMEAKIDLEDFGKTFVVLNTDKQKRVLKTAKTLLNVQRVSHVLIDNAVDLPAFSVNERKAN